MDEQTRRHERLAASGDLEAAAAVLRERVHKGELTMDHVTLAAALGNPAAQGILPDCALVDWSGAGEPSRHGEEVPGTSPSQIAVGKATALLGSDLPSALALDFAERALSAWERSHPGNGQLRAGFSALRAELACPCERHRAISSAEGNAVSSLPRVSDSALGTHAVAAFELAWLTHLSRTSGVAAQNTAAGIASMIREQVGDPEAEAEWQRLRLAAYVLGEA